MALTTSSKPLPRPVLSKWTHLLAFGFGAGCSPKAPGTMGTLLAVAFYLPLSHVPLGVYLSALIVITLFGVWVCERASRDLGVHDHPGIVWDEIAGYLLTMTAAPPGWIWVAIGFALFRLFDIWKPWPIAWLDRRVQGGLGIMLDDIVAGVFAALCLQLIAYGWP